MLRTPLPSPAVPYDSESHLFIRSISTECPPCPPHTVTPRHPRGPVFPFVPFQSALLARPLLCPSGSDRTERDPRSVDSSLARCADAAAAGLAHLRTLLAHSSVTHSPGDGTGSLPVWVYYSKACVNARACLWGPARSLLHLRA